MNSEGRWDMSSTMTGPQWWRLRTTNSEWKPALDAHIYSIGQWPFSMKQVHQINQAKFGSSSSYSSDYHVNSLAIFFCQSFSLVLCRAAVLFFLVTPCFNSSYVSTTQFCLRIARTSCYLDFSNLCWIRLIVWIWIELYGTTLAPTDLLGCVWQFLQLSETENLTCTPTLIIGHLCRANKISRAWKSLFISFIIIDTAISVTFYAYNWVQHYEYHKCMLLSPHINNEASPISYYFHFYF